MAKFVVIDTSVARACGGLDAVHPTSKNCRDFLLAFRAGGNTLAFSEDLRCEWREHKSTFARTWLVSMNARRNVEKLSLAPHVHLRNRILLDTPEPAAKREVLKDFHLIEAALETDRVVVSLEKVSLAFFHRAARNRAAELRQVMWRDPCVEPTDVQTWAAEGCAELPQHLLGR